jgi:ADP-ribosyl-[dinitrogen reductase] hydrolase
MKSLEDKFIGTLIGLACGDAVGSTVEFSPRGSFEPVTGMTGGGPFGLKPGQWTDDTSMALCLAQSLVERSCFNALDQMLKYVAWWRQGYLSSTGSCFDIGNTVSGALARFENTGDPYSGSTERRSAGNGSLMRLAPVVLFGFNTPELIPALAADSSRTTHGAAEAIECCQLFAMLIYRALTGIPKSDLLAEILLALDEPKVRELATGAFLEKPYAALVGSGYCVPSLEAALWCFFNTDSFEEAVLAAVNLGDDADTTGAITGQIAGAFYGASAIPGEWVTLLTMRSEIETLARALHQAC